ncbi:MAG: SEC-C metal-binding domain-containing protein [Hyphomicrobiaceae bacterium]
MADAALLGGSTLDGRGGGGERRDPVQSRRSGVASDPGDPSTWGRVSRNAPCPCGSGKKYKHCHGKHE